MLNFAIVRKIKSITVFYMSVKSSVSGFIQAGGKSQRMGQNKALMLLAGHKLIEYPIKALSNVVSQLAIITNEPESYSDLNIDCYPDIWPGSGPLAGIYAALYHSKTDYILTLACDMPLVSTELLELLIEKGESYQICVPKDFQQQLQPLCAMYHKSCQTEIQQLIEKKQYAPKALFPLVKTRILEFEILSGLANSKEVFRNINTPEDFFFLQNLSNKE